ncbi:hypothetical protein Taro_045832 [Colocasia esculenta]|uniref:Uncharacterized protein n=1 Tax=Colocasia esculenta TaxID=4460 RepID=A0A843WQK1_COLES|nr:hypothetical protein [Colocasia esculenta]
MGVPGNGNNLSRGTSPQVPSIGRRTSVDRTRELAQVPRVQGGFRNSSSGDHPKAPNKPSIGGGEHA